MESAKSKEQRNLEDRGSTLLIMTGAMTVLLGIAGLAIDLVSFYAVRAEAQRAADAAALAGAKMFISSGCTTAAGGCIAGGPQESLAIQQAETVGNSNLVAGTPANIQDADITFRYPNPEEPEITVVAARDKNHSGALPTIFGKIFGVQTVDISVSATAEAFNPSGAGVPIGSTCVKPWLLPNCDPDHNTPTTNNNCPTNIAPFIDQYGNILNPGSVSTGGVAGETLVLKPGSPSAAPAPSQFYPVDLPSAAGYLCPSCSNGGTGGSGASLYRSNIECCNQTPIVCGTLSVSFETGDIRGPTQQGTICLINEQNNGSGQDILASASPLSITGGSANPNPALQGVTGLTQSNSVATVPLYDGHNLCPGGSCGSTVTIVGFLQVFVTSVDSNGNVNATVLNVGGCGSSAGGSGGTSPAAMADAASFVPIRLIRR
jgi:hypothetical protein